MNQWLADLFLSLPPALSATHTFGAICLAFGWWAYVAAIRAPIVRAVRINCKPAFVEEHLARPWQRLFYTAARKKANLDEGGVYLINLGAFLLLLMASVMHAALFSLCAQEVVAAVWADRVALTIALGIVCVLALITQPRATIERRMRWGFGKTSCIISALLWEAGIAALLFLWLYDAWFLPALL